MAAKIPRNLRQVGNPANGLSIYIEDYVFTYLKSEYNSEAAIIVGESFYEEEGVKVFIRGAISCPQLCWREEGIELTPRTWNYIYREVEHLYSGQEVVGWYLPVPSQEAEKVLVSLGEFHGRNFPGVDKVFFYRNDRSGDESFYVRDGQIFKRQPGYYIFYEKNLPMRDYMLARREERQLEADLNKEIHEQPREMIRYRELVNTELDKKSKDTNLLAYGLSVFALVGVLALAVGVVTGYQEVNDMGNILKTLGNLIDDNEPESTDVSTEVDAPETTDPEQSLIDGTQYDNSTDSTGNSDENIAGEVPEDTATSPEDTSDVETSADNEAALALAQGYYVVQKGESLAAISRKLYGTDDKVEAICDKNGITNPDTIYPGQTLYLP